MNEIAERNGHVYLALLPLQVLADGPKVEMFCQGLVMDLITDLSRFRTLQIISYDSIKALHPNEQIDSPKLDSLQLDYLVRGMARYRKERLLINLQLVNVPENRLVWAEKFSGTFDELFQIQEEVVEKVAVSLQHFVDYDVLNSIRQKPLTSLNVYECWLKGYQELKKGSQESDKKARKYFRSAMEMDPNFARAYTGMSLTFFNEWSCQLWNRWEVSRNGAFKWAQKALELADWDHVSNAILGRIYLFNAEYERAERYLRKSLEINPNDASTLFLISTSFVYLGYLNEAKDLYERARRINPANEFDSYACGTLVYFESGEFEKALALAEQHELGRGWVDFPAFKAATYYLTGDEHKMRSCWQEFLKDFSLKINDGKPAETKIALKWMINVNPYRGETQLRPFWEYISQSDPEDLVVEKTTESSNHNNRFVQKGDVWILNYDGDEIQVPDLKGCHDIANLLANPRTPIHCTELMHAKVVESGQPVFDEQAKQDYREQIRILQEQIAEAEKRYDSERLAELQHEYDQLLDHLSKATGKGGNARKVSGTIEKARSAVTWRIRSAITKIGDQHPDLGKHLDLSVKTGVFCEYSPEHDIDWIV